MAMRSRPVTIILWLLQIVVAGIFLIAGGSKLAGAAPMVDMFNAIGVGQWFRYVTGLIEVGSAILLLVPSLAIVGAILLICTMVCAIIAHFTILHTPPTMPVVLLALSALIAWLRRPIATPARA